MLFPRAALYLLFFLSGFSGLIYQVVWVLEFGNVFGNTIQSASIVTAVFMLGLGISSYVVGVWADRRYIARPESLVRVYGYVEMLMGGTLTLLVRHMVRSDVETGRWRIALLYGINTAGASLGCFLTDVAL